MNALLLAVTVSVSPLSFLSGGGFESITMDNLGSYYLEYEYGSGETTCQCSPELPESICLTRAKAEGVYVEVCKTVKRRNYVEISPFMTCEVFSGEDFTVQCMRGEQ